MEKNDLMILIVGNKADLKERAVPKSKVDTWLRNYNDFQYKEVSAKTGAGIEETFQMAAELFLKKSKNNKHEP